MRYGVNVDEITTHNHPNTYCNKTQKQVMIQNSTMSKIHTAWQAVDAPFQSNTVTEPAQYHNHSEQNTTKTPINNKQEAPGQSLTRFLTRI